MTYILIDTRIYPLDTPAQRTTAQVAMRDAGMREAPVYVAPAGSLVTLATAGPSAPETYASGLTLCAEAQRPCARG